MWWERKLLRESGESGEVGGRHEREAGKGWVVRLSDVMRWLNSYALSVS